MKLPFKKIIDSNHIFVFIVAIFILALGITVFYSDGRDLKAGLFGVEMILQKKSPYENPTDPNRTIFRYAPGIAILQYPFLMNAEMIAPFKFKNIMPSVFGWYLTEILSLIFSALILLRPIPSLSHKLSVRNLKIAFLMSMPLIGYELSNSQNKLVALFFVLLAIFLFEKK